MANRTTTNSEVKITVGSTIRNTMDDGQVASLTVGQQLTSGSLASGVSANQINRAWEDRGRVIASGNTEDIDLYDLAGIDIGGGAGRDGLGQTWVLEEIVTLVIKQTAGPGRLEIMPSSPTGALTWMPALTVANGGALRTNGVLLLHQPDTDGLDVADATSHVIRLGANGGEVTYNIYILGRHDDDESSSSSSSSTSSLSSSSSNSSSSTSSQSSVSSSSKSSSTSSSSSASSGSTSSISSRTLSSSSASSQSP